MKKKRYISVAPINKYIIHCRKYTPKPDNATTLWNYNVFNVILFGKTPDLRAVENAVKMSIIGGSKFMPQFIQEITSVNHSLLCCLNINWQVKKKKKKTQADCSNLLKAKFSPKSL